MNSVNINTIIQCGCFGAIDVRVEGTWDMNWAGEPIVEITEVRPTFSAIQKLLSFNLLDILIPDAIEDLETRLQCHIKTRI